MDIYKQIEENYKLMLESGQIEAWSAYGRFAGRTHLEISKQQIKQWNIDNRELKSKQALHQWKEGRGVLDQSKIRSAMLEKHGVENIRHLKSTCPHCGKEGQHIAMLRWHYDKCKLA